MENLNDAEFGSDKNTEEAPILVAQRYLNIFRQIHIFNKEKRTQFDDELLALPQNIMDFFKRMPGGRLLVEHIEDVKTERGISFVKSNKEDFSNGTEGGNTNAEGGNAGNVAGGNVVIDASFAETLAKSMSAAFSQIPNSKQTDTVILSDLNKTFQLINEELKASRNFLMEVLQENRQITASVIASQAALSQLLEKFSNTLHNVKLPAHSPSVTESRNDVLVTPNRNLMPNAPHTEQLNTSPIDEVAKKKKKKKKHNKPDSAGNDEVLTDSNKIATAFSGVINDITSKPEAELHNISTNFADTPDLSLDDSFSENTIHSEIETSDNTSFTEHSDFSDFTRMETEPVTNDDGLDFVLPEQGATLSSTEHPLINSNRLDGYVSDDGLEFSLPEQGIAVTEPQEVDNSFNDDVFSAPVVESAIEETSTPSSFDGLDSLLSDDTFSAPKQEETVEEEPENTSFDGLDNLLSDDTFSAPKQEETVEEEPEHTSFDGLDSLLSDDTFSAPEQEETVEEESENTSLDGLDSLLSDDTFSVPEQNLSTDVPNTDITPEEPIASQETRSRYSEELDRIRAALTSNNVDISSLDQPIALDDYSDDENIKPETDEIFESTQFNSQNSSNVSQPETDATLLGSQAQTDDEEDWEWEYVDENGNPIEASDEDADWEWEYVEDDGSDGEPDNNNK